MRATIRSGRASSVTVIDTYEAVVAWSGSVSSSSMVPSSTAMPRSVGMGTTSMPVTEVASVVTRVTDLVAPASENEYAMGEPA